LWGDPETATVAGADGVSSSAADAVVEPEAAAGVKKWGSRHSSRHQRELQPALYHLRVGRTSKLRRLANIVNKPLVFVYEICNQRPQVSAFRNIVICMMSIYIVLFQPFSERAFSRHRNHGVFVVRMFVCVGDCFKDANVSQRNTCI
jgi:hypothetical protein